LIQDLLIQEGNNMDKDYLKKRAEELGLGRGDTLSSIQAWLDGHYPDMCRALSINNGVLRVTTAESAVASELRLRQVELVDKFGDSGVVRLAISIRG
jgi:hypothetical protein